MQYHPWYIIFDVQRIFLEQKLISLAKARKLSILSTELDIFDSTLYIFSIY